VARHAAAGPLLAAKRLVYLVTGEDKAETLRAVFEEKSDPEKYPVQIAAEHPVGADWFLDEAAARLLVCEPHYLESPATRSPALRNAGGLRAGDLLGSGSGTVTARRRWLRWLPSSLGLVGGSQVKLGSLRPKWPKAAVLR